MENNTILCSTCGTENPDNFKFCSNCGSEIKKPEPEPVVKTCPQCNSVFETESAFCGNCGTRLVVPEPEPPVEEVVEEEPTTIVCTTCGAENGIEFAFCATCGSKLQKPGMPKVCPNCNNECAPEVSFCPVCGTSVGAKPAAQPIAQPTYQPVAQPTYQPVAQPSAQPTYQQPAYQSAYQPAAKHVYQPQEPIQPAPPKKATKFGFDLKKLISSGVLALLSLILLLCSFAPVIKYTIKDEDTKETLSIKINAFDAAGFMFDNIRNQDAEEIADSKLATKAEELLESIDDIDYEDLSRSDKKTISKLYKLEYKAYLRSEDTKISASIIVAGAASVAYIVLSLITLVYAALSLMAIFTKTKSYSGSSIKCFTIAPFMALIARAALKTNAYLSSALGSDAKISSPVVIWGLIFACLIVAGTIAQKIIFEKKSISLKNAIFNLVTVVIATITVALCSSNVMKATVKAQFDNRDTESTVTTKIDSSFYEYLKNQYKSVEDTLESTLDTFKDSDDAKEMKKMYVSNIISRYENYSAKDVKNGEADTVTNNTLFWSIAIWNDNTITLFTIIPLLLLVAVVFAALTAAFALSKIASEEGPSKSMSIFAVLCAVASIIAFAANFLFILTVKKFMTYVRLSSTFKLGVASGMLALVVFSVLLIIATRLNKQKTNSNKRTNGQRVVVNSWGERMEMSRF